ncbi:MAG: hypothetical protein ACI9S8_001355 [Chlamydiales bacterium]
MTIILHLPPYPENKWSKEHPLKLRPFEIVNKTKYSELFSNYVPNNLNFEENSIVQACCKNILHKSSKKVFRKLKDSSFGIAAALHDCHTQCIEPIIPLTTEDNFFLKKALYYSMADLLKHKLEKAQKKSPSFKTFREYKDFRGFIDNFSSAKQATLRSQQVHHGEEFLTDIRNALSECVNSAIVLKIASEFSHPKTFFTKNSRWIHRHSLFVFINNERKFFYFYDNELKAIVQETSCEGLLNTFADYIRREKPDYLRPHVVWQFSWSPAKND